MTIKTIYRNIGIMAFAAATAMGVMLLISLFNSEPITQQYFEILQPAEKYAAKLLLHAATIKAILTFDNAFIVLYTATFILLTMAVSFHKNYPIAGIGLVALLGTALLDFYENHHIFSFITQLENHLPISQEEINSQMSWSQLKFHLSYMGLFLFAFVLPAEKFLEKLLKYSLFFIQLPVGILAYTAPENLLPYFGTMRYVLMLGGLALVSVNYYKKYKSEI